MKLFALALSASVVAVPVFAQEVPSPGIQFLKAADAGDFETMAALLDPKSPVDADTLLAKTKSCYVRSIFGTPERTMVAAWMCAESQGKSRILMTEVGDGAGGAEVIITKETKQGLPFLPKTRSIFKEEKPSG